MGRNHVTALALPDAFVPFSPRFEAVLPDGRRGLAELDCAFSAGRDHVIEVMQPVSGLVAAAAHGLTRVLEARVEGRFAFAYHALPELGHHVEHIQYFGDAGSFLESVRSRSDSTSEGSSA
jgi:hypothetical protein